MDADDGQELYKGDDAKVMCPVCGREMKHSQGGCPKIKKESICTECCTSCDYYKKNYSGYGNPCTWYIQQPEYKMIIELREKAGKLKKKKELLWARKNNTAAMIVEAEWRAVMVEMNTLREKLDKKAGGVNDEANV